MKICDYPLVGPLFEMFTDCDGGGSGVVVTQEGLPNEDFQPAVPEPGAGLLFMVAFGVIAVWYSLCRKASK